MRASWIEPMTCITHHSHFTYEETEASERLSTLLQVKQLKTWWSQRNECLNCRLEIKIEKIWLERAESLGLNAWVGHK